MLNIRIGYSTFFVRVCLRWFGYELKRANVLDAKEAKISLTREAVVKNLFVDIRVETMMRPTKYHPGRQKEISYLKAYRVHE